MKYDVPESTVPYVAELLDAGIRVVVYNGDRDLSVNAQGSERLLDDMVWSGSEGWKTTKRYLWMVNNEVAGYAKSYKNLDFIIVYNSGHLVPNNVPIAALDLITRFVQNETFQDIELPYYEPRNRSLPPSFECPTNQEQYTMEEEQGSSNKIWTPFHSFLIVCVAIVCFFGGFLTSWFFGTGGRRQRKGYTRISVESDEMDGNGGSYQMQQSTATRGNTDNI